MNTTGANSGRVRACRDRCEVCNRVIEARPDAKRRRCGDHLDQLVLVPAPRARKTGTTGKSRKTTGTTDGEARR